jgi:hypothetical protein
MQGVLSLKNLASFYLFVGQPAPVNVKMRHKEDQVTYTVVWGAELPLNG